MNFEILKSKVEKAIEELIEKDISLLKSNVNERTISTTLGAYLKPHFDNYNVDCEYNKNKEDFNQKKYIYEIEYITGQKINPSEVIPDIIIHEREVNRNNLLLIEVKKSVSRPRDIRHDEIKLKAVTTSHLSNLDYCFGLLLIIGVKDNAGSYELKWYEDGQEIESDSNSI